MRVACLLRDELHVADVEVYGRKWLTRVNTYGGQQREHVRPPEGTNDVADALFTFPGLAASETDRERSAQDPVCQALFKNLPALAHHFDGRL